MAHLMKTINEDAAKDLSAPEPLPGVGESVVFYPRPGELRAGRGKHAAIVTASNDDDQSLDLVVIYDADDFIGQRKVKRRSLDGGMGWEPMYATKTLPAAVLAPDLEAINMLSKQIAELKATVVNLTSAVFGDFDVPKESLVDIMGEHEDRMQKIEDMVTPPVTRAKAKKVPKTKAK